MLNNLLLTGIAAAFAFVAPPTPDVSGPANKDRAAKHKRGKRAGKRHKKNLCAKLECTDAQKAELKELRTEFKATTKPMREKAKSLHASLKAERAKDNPNATVIEGLRAEVKTLKTSMKAAKKAHMAAAKDVFTPEQVAQLETIKAERKAKRGDKRKRGKGDKARRGKSKRKGKGDKARRGKGQGKDKKSARRGRRGNDGERSFANRRGRLRANG